MGKNTVRPFIKYTVLLSLSLILLAATLGGIFFGYLYVSYRWYEHTRGDLTIEDIRRRHRTILTPRQAVDFAISQPELFDKLTEVFSIHDIDPMRTKYSWLAKASYSETDDIWSFNIRTTTIGEHYGCNMKFTSAGSLIE